jgi:hypothetical protein
MFEEKQQFIIINKKNKKNTKKKLNWQGLIRGGSHMTCPLSPLVMGRIFHSGHDLNVRTIYMEAYLRYTQVIYERHA